MKKIVVLGGGYGGLTFIHKLLEGKLPPGTSLTLIDRMPFQGLKTEYYALAAGTIAESHIRVSFPEDDRLKLLFGEIIHINLAAKTVHLLNGETVPYDVLAVALGCTDKYHGVPGAVQNTLSIQSFSSSRRTYQLLNDLQPYRQVSIIGGGLSGVEMASELREARPDLNIRVIDRGNSILSPFPEKLQRYVRSWFEEHEVELCSNIGLTQVEEGALHHQSGSFSTDLTVWTAGIQPVEVVQQMDLPKDHQGRLVINAFHQLPAHPEVFILGDCASLPFSPSAQAAEAQGKQAAEVLQALWKNETPKLGQIKLKGVLGSLGKKSGFGLMGGRTVMIGRVPRLLKSGVLWMSKHHLG